MSDRTVITFDRPDERVIELPRLLPMLRRDDELVIEDRSHVVRSATLAIETNGDLSLHVHLRL